MEKHDLAYGRSSVYFGSVEELASLIPPDAFVITDENVARCWGAGFSGWPSLVLPPGEGTKSFAFYQQAVDRVATAGLKRSGTIVALGGGVIGDLAGFVSATYMRGVALIQFPTTLLAQVDSSVGGKVGIDLPQGKNLLGCFHQPEKVLVAVETLRTLEPRHLTNGMAEVLKYGFIMDPGLLETLAETQGEPDCAEIVLRCIRLKESVVTEDERDLTGRRAILNFGHTVGHALEALQDYAGLLHGEAVAVGMAVEAKLGEAIGLTPPGTHRTVVEILQKHGLPTHSPDLQRTEELIGFMANDKKATGTGLSFSLLEAVGRCKLVENVPADAVREALLKA